MTISRWLPVLVMVLLLGLTNVPQVAPAAPPPVFDAPITVRDGGEVEVRRAAILTYIFGSATLPSTRPTVVDSGWLVTMENGFTSLIREYPPAHPNGAAVIFHNGHGPDNDSTQRVREGMLDAGYTVYVLDMPLIGTNPLVTLNK